MENKPTNYVRLISLALFNKSRLSFRYYKPELVAQASFFSPAYQEFIYKVIKNSSLKIKHQSKKGYITPDNSFSGTTFGKRSHNQIVTDIREVDYLPHELGHAADFWFNYPKTLSADVILSNGYTLQETFDKEFKSKQKEIYEEIMNEYKSIINSNINEKAFDTLMDNQDLYKELMGCKDKKRRKEIHKILYENGFVEAYYVFHQKKCYSILNKKYSPVLDALSSLYELNWLFIECHTPAYYQIHKNRPTEEFFANMFGIKVTNQSIQYEYLEKYLPESCKAFEELFQIFYDKIQNNKNLNNLKIKEEEPDDE
jgi:hypothetical protein